MGTPALKGDWLLFTDGDIVYSSKQTVSKALSYAEANNLDHLTLIPSFIGKNVFVRTFSTHIFLLLVALLRPWQLKKPGGKGFVGLGAFNLVKRSVYEDIGTHKEIALRPDDDGKLGQLIKKKGYIQELLFGRDMLEVRWYNDVGQIVQGIEKNCLTLTNYRLAPIPFIYVFEFTINLYPFIGPFIGSPLNRSISMLTVGCIYAMYIRFRKYFGNPAWHALFHPIAGLISTYGAAIGVVKTIIHGGMVWRGTKYSLELLRKNSL